VTKRRKRLERLREHPKNVSLDELRQVLEDYGFEYRQTVGSHFTFSVEIGGVMKLLVVPFRRPLKPIYVKKALELIDQVMAGQEEESWQDEADESGNDENT
jgi:predicted RNA binding protein YcfA (HicA-like mRNA interferase family)